MFFPCFTSSALYLYVRKEFRRLKAEPGARCYYGFLTSETVCPDAPDNGEFGGNIFIARGSSM